MPINTVAPEHDDFIPSLPLDRTDPDFYLTDDELAARAEQDDIVESGLRGERIIRMLDDPGAPPLRIVRDDELAAQQLDRQARQAQRMAAMKLYRETGSIGAAYPTDRAQFVEWSGKTLRDWPIGSPMPGNAIARASTAVDAETLLGMVFSPIKYVVPGFVAEGLTILGGRPKLGKSWLALDFGIGVASGGVCLGATCGQGDALYLALEDNQRRLQDRLRLVLPQQGRPDIRRLTLDTEAPKIGAGLIERLDAWRIAAELPLLVVVDTLAMVRQAKGRNQDSYAADYDALSPLQRWASEHRIAVVVVTHVRKMEAEDPLEMISGTNGLTGAADSILVLTRTADGPKLYGRGRDVEEVEKALRFDTGRWFVIGDAADAKRSDERRQIITALKADNHSPAEIAKATGMKLANVQYLLGKMVEAGEAEKGGYGLYVPASEC